MYTTPSETLPNRIDHVYPESKLRWGMSMKVCTISEETIKIMQPWQM